MAWVTCSIFDVSCRRACRNLDQANAKWLVEFVNDDVDSLLIRNLIEHFRSSKHRIFGPTNTFRPKGQDNNSLDLSVPFDFFVSKSRPAFWKSRTFPAHECQTHSGPKGEEIDSRVSLSKLFRPNGPALYLAQAAGLGNSTMETFRANGPADCVFDVHRMVHIDIEIVIRHTGKHRTFGPPRIYCSPFPGVPPGLGKPPNLRPEECPTHSGPTGEGIDSRVSLQNYSGPTGQSFT